MVGSVEEAGDLTQETFLRAGRHIGGFEGRSALRAWLYRIATNACLDALDGRARRVLPQDLEPATTDPGLAPPRWSPGPTSPGFGPSPTACGSPTPSPCAGRRSSWRSSPPSLQGEQ
jgi:RNA polymerase sigma factor (sigma-70 family)